MAADAGDGHATAGAPRTVASPAALAEPLLALARLAGAVILTY